LAPLNLHGIGLRSSKGILEVRPASLLDSHLFYMLQLLPLPRSYRLGGEATQELARVLMAILGPPAQEPIGIFG
jgi:hypothetical protein